MVQPKRRRSACQFLLKLSAYTGTTYSSQVLLSGYAVDSSVAGWFFTHGW